MKLSHRIYILVLLIFAAASFACVQPSAEQGAKPGTPGSTTKKLRIGFSMDTLKEERWQKDRDLFVARAEELGAEVLVQSADGNDTTQLRQVEGLLVQGIDVLVVIPHNGEVAATIVEAAKRSNVPVISYDRLIRNSDVDLYISFDNEKVGEMQAKYLVEHAPTGNYILIGGAPTDNNARMFRDGQMRILQPYVDRGEIKIVADQWARDWLPEEAMKHTENALTVAGDKVAAVLTSNDGTAGGAVQALTRVNLGSKVLVSGQDADLAALQRIVAGTQTMTVYKPVSVLAVRAAEAAIALAKRETVPTDRTVNNGKSDIRSILLDPVLVDRENLEATVIKDGFQKREEVFKDAR